MGIIYKITNKTNNKVYIGKTSKSVEYRMSQHIKKAMNKTNRRLYDAMNKYGLDNFVIEPIEYCDDINLNDREIYWISVYDSMNPSKGYNMTSGGDGGDTWTNNQNKEDTIRKIIQTKLDRGVFDNYPHIPSKMKGKHYIDLPSKEELLRDILYPLNVYTISCKYGCSKWTITNLIKEYFNNKTANQIRKENGVSIPKTEKQIESIKLIHKKYKHKTGEDNTSFKPIDRDTMLKCIMDGRSIEYMMELFEVSKPTLIKRCRYLFGKTIREMRRCNYE